MTADSLEGFRRATLDDYAREYEELSRDWKSLDTKAQGNVAISGIFIAAVFAFIRQLSQPVDSWGSVLISFSLLALTGSIVLSVLALRLRASTMPPTGEAIDETYSDLAQLDPEELRERAGEISEEIRQQWRDATGQVRGHNKSKALHLTWAQWLLLAAAAMVALHSLRILWS